MNCDLSRTAKNVLSRFRSRYASPPQEDSGEKDLGYDKDEANARWGAKERPSGRKDRVFPLTLLLCTAR